MVNLKVGIPANQQTSSDTFPIANRKTVWRAMDYITRSWKVFSCITFREATEMTEDYILIGDGVNLLVLINYVGPPHGVGAWVGEGCATLPGRAFNLLIDDWIIGPSLI